MKKIFTLLMAATTLSASALTMDDLAGLWSSTESYGKTGYVAAAAYGVEIDTIANVDISVNGNNIILSNFVGETTMTGVVDLQARTITFPVQDVTAVTGYTFTFCKYDDIQYGDTSGYTPEPYVATIDENGDIVMPKYFSYYGWGANYGWGYCTLHRYETYSVSEEIKPVLGNYDVTSFTGEWTWIFAEGDDADWHTFDASTGEGYDEIYGEVGKLPYSVSVVGVKDNDVFVSGVLWGDSDASFRGSVDMATKTITFPVQTVYGGYTLCNYSAMEEDEPVTESPAVATITDDGKILLDYCFTYEGYLYLGAKMTLTPVPTSGISSVISTNNAPVEYFNLQGIRVNNPAAGNIYIQRQGNTVKKVIK